jgi:hypothetical protein
VIAVVLRHKNVKLAGDEGASNTDPFASCKTAASAKALRSIELPGLARLPRAEWTSLANSPSRPVLGCDDWPLPSEGNCNL